MICVAVGMGCPRSVQLAVRATSSVQFRTWAAGLCRQCSTRRFLEFGFETHARIFFEYLLEHLRRDLIEAETQEIEPRTEMNQGYFARKPRGNSGRGMQRDRLPNHIGALWRHLMIYAEIASGLGAIHLKPVVAAIGRDQTKIVQNRPAKRGLLIDHRTSDTPDGQASENVRAQTMRAEKCG